MISYNSMSQYIYIKRCPKLSILQRFIFYSSCVIYKIAEKRLFVNSFLHFSLTYFQYFNFIYINFILLHKKHTFYEFFLFFIIALLTIFDIVLVFSMNVSVLLINYPFIVLMTFTNIDIIKIHILSMFSNFQFTLLYRHYFIF